MRLTLSAGAGDMASIDLGGLNGGYLGHDDLAATGGNLYLFIDGEEWGSLFFHMVDGKLRIELGQFDFETGDWESKSRLTKSVAETKVDS